MERPRTRIRPAAILGPFIVKSLNADGCQTPAQLAARYNQRPAHSKLKTVTTLDMRLQMEPLLRRGQARTVSKGVYGPYRDITLLDRIAADKPHFNTLRHGLQKFRGFARGMVVPAAEFGPGSLCYATRLKHIKALIADQLVFRVRGFDVMMIQIASTLEQALKGAPTVRVTAAEKRARETEALRRHLFGD